MTAEEKAKFITLYNLYQEDIFRYLLFRLRDRDLARDLTQETFIKTWKYLLDNRRIEKERAFIYKVATNLIIDNSKKKKAVSLDELMETGFNVTDRTGISEAEKFDIAIALKQLDSLEDEYKEAVMLRYVNGLAVTEIAEMIGITENLASVRIHRGLKMLREVVKK